MGRKESNQTNKQTKDKLKTLFYLPGSLFASVASVEVIGSITANISENTIYAATVSVINGFVFFVMAGYIFIDLIMLV